MSVREWPPVVSLLPGARGLDSNIAPLPKYEQLAAECPNEAPVLNTEDLRAQEQQLVRDVLRVLSGGEGAFVRFIETFDPVLLDDRLLGPQYRLKSGIDKGLRDILLRIVNAASCAYTVRTYADHFASLEYGRVNQALSAAFRVLLHLYLEIVAKLEAQRRGGGEAPRERASHDLTLHRVWAALEPFWPHLENAQRLIHRFIEETRLVRDRKRQGLHDDLIARATTAQFVAHGEKEATIELRGGAVLHTIAAQLRLELGNASAANLYNELLAAASKPYLAMLQRWLSCGEIDDPRGEFLVQETGAHNPLEAAGRQSVDDYWDKRFTIRAFDLPLQLSTPQLYNRLLVAGKYLNVIRDTTGNRAVAPQAADLESCTSVEDARVAEAVSRTYRHANIALLDLYRTPQHDLKWLLRALRDTFFLTGNDTFLSFLDAAGDELARPASEVSLTQLESVLTLLRPPEDKIGDYVGLSLAQESLRDAMLRIVANSDDYEPATHANASLSVVDALQLTFEVPFPLSLVVPRRSIVRYQFLFRHVLDLLMAQRALTEAWELQMLAPQWRTTENDVDHWKHRAHMLRQRQLLFANELLYHCTQDSINRGWTELYATVDTFEEVSELAEYHISFLDRCLVNCYLAHPQLLRFQTRLLTHCRQYGQFLKVNIQLVEYMAADPTKTMLDADGHELRPQDLLEWFAAHVERYESSFDRNLQRYYEQLAAFVPTNFVAGGATASLMQRLQPLLAEYERSDAGVVVGEPSGGLRQHEDAGALLQE